MKRLIATAAILLLTLFSVSAYAMTYYLVKQWSSPQGHMCQYGNGTVLNVGVNLCPLSIEG